MQSWLTLGLGLVIAWIIIQYLPKQKVSYFTLQPWPLELDDSNLALIGVGLESRVPEPSVMDATPAAPKTVAIMSPQVPQPMMMPQTPQMPPPPMMMPQAPQPMMMPTSTLMPSPSV